MELGAGRGATALVFNMHASVTGALAQTPDDVARAVGVPESYFAMRDRALRQAADGALFAVAMSERGAGSRLSKLTELVRAGRRRLPPHRLEDIRVRRRARRLLPGRGPAWGRGVALPRPRRPRAHRRAHLGLDGHARHRQRRPAPRRHRRRRRAARRHRGADPAAGPGDAAVAGRLVRGGVRRGGPLRGHRGDRAPAGALADRAARGPGQGRPGRGEGGGGPAGSCWRRPAGWTPPRATRRRTAGCGVPSCLPARPRWTWPRRCWRRPAPRRCGGVRRWSGSSGTPGVARCSRPPPTSCADWLGAAALGDDPEAGGRW
jgi:hypothetical protein